MNNPAKSFAFISPDKFARETLIKNCGRFAGSIIISYIF